MGWSLTGYQVIAPSGSLTTMAPSRVVTQPYGTPSRSSGTVVSPPYATTSSTVRPALIFGRGWTTSSHFRCASSWTCQ